MNKQHINGDPLGESQILIAIQDVLYERPGIPAAARGLSHFGEHALGWMGIGAAGAMIARKSPAQRRSWLAVVAAALSSHAASVILKRVVRRPRPHAQEIRIGVGTPSKLSFPSSHATSTTAAAIAISRALKNKTPLGIIPIMMASRMVLGVHYPSDVLAGAALGATSAVAVQRIMEK
ncbi:MAG: phosphatase PAP2 family protein [Corynebacterium sp.]|nr:phosphatase PAP2 family protein [Corynebacterium sp.]